MTGGSDTVVAGVQALGGGVGGAQGLVAPSRVTSARWWPHHQFRIYALVMNSHEQTILFRVRS